MKIKKMIAAVTALVLVGGAYNVTAEKSFISSVLAADTEDSVEVVKDGIEYTLSNGEAVVNGVVDASIVDLVIPDEVDDCPVTEIGEFAFNPYYNKIHPHIKTLTLGKNVKKICNSAFSECYELETVTFNDELEDIDDFSFARCYSLKELRVGSKLKHIGLVAFNACVNLKSFEIGENVEEIESGAFERSGIEVFEVPERFTEIKNVFDANNRNKDDSGIVKINNPECRLFGDEESWKSTLIVCDEESIAKQQAERYNLKWCTFEQYEKGEYEKRELSPLDDFICLRDYGMWFDETDGGLKINRILMSKDGTLIIPDEVAGIPVVEFGIFDAEQDMFSIDSITAEDTKKIVLGKNIKRLGENAFEDFDNLEVIEGGEGLEEIGKNAFGDLQNLKSVSFSDNIKDMKFDATDRLICNIAYGMEFEEVNGNLVIKEISDNAVKDGTLVIPDEVQGLPLSYINEADSKGLISSTVSDGLKLDFYILPAYRLNFISNEIKKKIEKVVIGKNIKTIPVETFIDCTNLESIEGGEGIEYIGDDAFKNCTKLDSLKLYDNVKEIGTSAFCGCTNLKTIELGSGLKEIGTSAFRDCRSLEEINLMDNISEIESYAFEGTNLKNIIIPESIKSIGVDSFTWKDNSSKSKAIVKIYSADCDFYSNSIDLDKVDKIYGYAGSTAERIANINYKNFYAFGDANCDKGIDMSDAVLIMQSLANPNKYGLNGTNEHHITEKGIDCADVDENGNGITASDALKIQKYLLGQEKFS